MSRGDDAGSGGLDRRSLLARLGLTVLGAAAVGGAALAGESGLLPTASGTEQRLTGATLARVGMAGTPLPDVRLGRSTVYWQAATSRRLVALTFDDGPAPQWTELTLDTLHRLGVRATFNLVGRQVERYPDLARRAARDGHELGNHTYAHHDLAGMDVTAAQDALVRGHRTIERVTGVAPRTLRPPYGHLGGAALLAAAELRYDVVLWSLRMREAELDVAGLGAWMGDQAQPGSILLAHDTGSADRIKGVRALPETVRRLRARGFELVTVSELIAAQDAEAGRG